jgi:hypothetical protein
LAARLGWHQLQRPKQNLPELPHKAVRSNGRSRAARIRPAKVGRLVVGIARWRHDVLEENDVAVTAGSIVLSKLSGAPALASYHLNVAQKQLLTSAGHASGQEQN